MQPVAVILLEMIPVSLSWRKRGNSTRPSPGPLPVVDLALDSVAFIVCFLSNPRRKSYQLGKIQQPTMLLGPPW